MGEAGSALLAGASGRSFVRRPLFLNLHVVRQSQAGSLKVLDVALDPNVTATALKSRRRAFWQLIRGESNCSVEAK